MSFILESQLQALSTQRAQCEFNSFAYDGLLFSAASASLRPLRQERLAVFSCAIRRVCLLLLYLALGFASTAQAQEFVEAPRVVAALAQGQAAERGKGVRKNMSLAIEFYCDAATMGSSEGFFRIGRMLAKAPGKQRNLPLANAYLALAARAYCTTRRWKTPESMKSAPIIWAKTTPSRST